MELNNTNIVRWIAIKAGALLITLIAILILSIILFSNSCTSQDRKKLSNNTLNQSSDIVENDSINQNVFECDYLGEIPPGNEPKIFSPNVISSGDLHSSLYFSPDGKEIYYSRLSSNGDNSGILCRKSENGKWSEPKIIQGTEEALTPFISLDGRRLFCSLGNDLFVMNRTKNAWGEPINLGKEINFQKRQDGIYESSKRTIFYTAMFGENDGIYYSEFISGKYQPPVKIDPGFPDHPTTGYSYISPDESYLIFQSRVKGGYGASDLYIMFKKGDGSWTKAVNMGKEINTKNSESFPYVGPDDKYFFFNSNRISVVNSKVPSHFYGNVYWVKTDIIHELKDEVFK